MARWVASALLGILWSAVGLAEEQGGFGHYAPSVVYTDSVSHTFYLPMRDGVRLALRVARPARDGQPVEGRFPVIWQGTFDISPPRPGGVLDTGRPGYSRMESLVRYGYVVVQLARRGTGQSFGKRRGYNDRTEADDAYEVTEWLADQPWSTGAIGVYGCSNTGDAAMHAVSVRPPHLKAAFAGCFSWSKWDAFHRGGLYAQWGVGIERTVDQDMQVTPIDGDGDKVLLREAAEQHQGSTPLRALWQGMPYRDSWSPLVASRFWYEGSTGSYADALRASDVALYIEDGWQDELRDQTLIALMNYPNSRILIGPWKHCLNLDFELLQEIHRFFDTYLKNIDTGLRDEPRIHYWLPGGAEGGRWLTATSWPLTTSHSQLWYFAARQGLRLERPTKPLEQHFVVTAHPTCPDGAMGMQMGAFMQPCAPTRDDAQFTAKPLRAPLEVTGHPTVSLTVSADRSDAHVFAYLEDVAPDGQTRVVTEGRLRAALRATSPAPWKLPQIPWHRAWEQDAQPLQPGEPVLLEFDLLPTAYVFPAGHRIALAFAGADFRESDPLPPGEALSVRSAPDSPAYLDLPVVDRQRQ